MNCALAEDIITVPPSAAKINSVYLFAINGCSPQPIRLNDSKIKCLKWQKQDETKTPAFPCLNWPARPFLCNIEAPLPCIHVIANGKRCNEWIHIIIPTNIFRLRGHFANIWQIFLMADNKPVATTLLWLNESQSRRRYFLVLLCWDITSNQIRSIQRALLCCFAIFPHNHSWPCCNMP